MRIRPTLIAAALLTLLVLGSAGAADTAPDKPDALAPARAQIAKKNWPAAIDELKKSNQTGNADWNNLMGYSLRKGPAPDYKTAEKFYNEALRLDPKHPRRAWPRSTRSGPERPAPRSRAHPRGRTAAAPGSRGLTPRPAA
jgi:hypothetical protein